MSVSETQENFILWKPEVTERGTFNIVVTCFTTFGISLWSALHLSIPQGRHSWKEALQVRLGWIAIGLFVPEFLIIVALNQRRQAAQLKREVNAHFKLMKTARPWYQRWLRWPSTETEEKDEERFLVRDPLDSTDSSSLRSRDTYVEGTKQAHIIDEKPMTKLASNFTFPRTKLGRNRWTLVHGFYAVMGGYAIYDGKGDLRTLDSTFVTKLLERNPELVPDLSEHTILDKSKADSLAKALLFTQIGWFCISCINRFIQNCPLALLEVSTIAHALCSMTVYILWWDKPLNIQEPFIFHDSNLLETYNLPIRYGNWYRIESANDTSTTNLSIILIVISLVYGGPHLLAWNSAFATHTEQLLWRVASCILASSGVYTLVFLLIDSFLQDHLPSALYRMLDGITFAPFCLAYLSANLYLIAASLRQLFHLPPAAFQIPAWSKYFPHIS